MVALLFYTCRLLLLVIDIFCGFIHPAFETLYYIRVYKHRRQHTLKLTHWTKYWIFYSVLHLVQKTLYFFPFAYEIRVILTLLMAHP